MQLVVLPLFALSSASIHAKPAIVLLAAIMGARAVPAFVTGLEVKVVVLAVVVLAVFVVCIVLATVVVTVVLAAALVAIVPAAAVVALVLAPAEYLVVVVESLVAVVATVVVVILVIAGAIAVLAAVVVSIVILAVAVVVVVLGMEVVVLGIEVVVLGIEVVALGIEVVLGFEVVVLTIEVAPPKFLSTSCRLCMYINIYIIRLVRWAPSSLVLFVQLMQLHHWLELSVCPFCGLWLLTLMRGACGLIRGPFSIQSPSTFPLYKGLVAIIALFAILF